MKLELDETDVCTTCVASRGCPNSKHQCGHHCNHSWSNGECCWCGEKFGTPVLDEAGVLQEALRVLGSPSKLVRWVNMELPALGGNTPFSLLHSKKGREQILGILDRIEQGIF
jgi:hypothetical protein